jgi:hypothetical protein
MLPILDEMIPKLRLVPVKREFEIWQPLDVCFRFASVCACGFLKLIPQIFQFTASHFESISLPRYRLLHRWSFCFFANHHFPAFGSQFRPFEQHTMFVSDFTFE